MGLVGNPVFLRVKKIYINISVKVMDIVLIAKALSNETRLHILT
jgi:hypothetical protein